MKKWQWLALLMAVCLLLSGLMGCQPADEPESSDSDTATTTTSGTTEAPEDSSEDDGIFDPGDIFGTTTVDGSSDNQTTVGGSSDKPTTVGGDKGTTATTKKTTTTTKKQPVYEQVLPDAVKKLPQYVQDVYKKLPDLETDEEKKVTLLTYLDVDASATLGYKYGITVESNKVAWYDLITTYVSMVNGGTCPDILISKYNYNMIKKQYVQAWNKHLNTKDSIWDDARARMDAFALAGQYYYFDVKGEADLESELYFLYNINMLEDAGVPLPADQFKNGEWDWNALEKAVEKLSPGAIWMYNGPQGLVNSTGHDYIDIINGRPKSMVRDGDISRAMTLYSKLVAHKGIDLVNTTVTARMKRDALAMCVGTQATIMTCKNEILKGQIGFTAIPRDPESEDYYAPYNCMGYYLGKEAKHVKNAVAYMYVMHYEGTLDYATKHNAQLRENGDKDVIPVEIETQLNEINRKSKKVLRTWDIFDSHFSEAVACIGANLNSGMSWSQNAATLEPVAQSSIKNFFG